MLPPGATQTSNPLGAGRIKVALDDFLVEELDMSGVSARQPLDYVPDTSLPYVRCVLQKQGVSTVQALHVLAKELDCSVHQLGLAGKKDVEATTWQFCTVPKQHAREVRIPGVHLMLHRATAQALTTGLLLGNRFTIRAHTAVPANQVTERLSELEALGTLAYFGVQRFGPRQLNHVIGEALLRGDYLGAAKLLVCEPSLHEAPPLASIRTRLVTSWPNYQVCLALVTGEPALRSEQVLLAALADGVPAHQAWQQLPMQSRFLVNAYCSYVFNLALAHVPNLPESLPTLTSQTDGWYREHGLVKGGFDYQQRQLRCARPSNHSLPTRVYPSHVAARQEPDAVLIQFDLPKGTYATTILSELFS